MPQFKKGQSGNPKGRPKGDKTQRTRIIEGFKKHVGTDAEEFFFNNLHDAICGGDSAALRLFGEWLMGKPHQTSENKNINENHEMSAEQAREKLAGLDADGLIKLVRGSDSSTDGPVEGSGKKRSA